MECVCVLHHYQLRADAPVIVKNTHKRTRSHTFLPPDFISQTTCRALGVIGCPFSLLMSRGEEGRGGEHAELYLLRISTQNFFSFFSFFLLSFFGELLYCFNPHIFCGGFLFLLNLFSCFYYKTKGEIPYQFFQIIPHQRLLIGFTGDRAARPPYKQGSCCLSLISDLFSGAQYSSAIILYNSEVLYMSISILCYLLYIFRGKYGPFYSTIFTAVVTFQIMILHKNIIQILVKD